MFKRCLLVALLCILFLPIGRAEGMSFDRVPELFRPGKADRITISVPADGEANLYLLNSDGQAIAIIRENFPVVAGQNHISWDGTQNSIPLPAGNYYLSMHFDGEEIRVPFIAGDPAPTILNVTGSDTAYPGKVWSQTVTTNMAGTLTMQIRLEDQAWHPFAEQQVVAGENVVYWNGVVEGNALPGGEYLIQMMMTDDVGFESTAYHLYFQVLSDAPLVTTTQPLQEPVQMTILTPPPVGALQPTATPAPLTLTMDALTPTPTSTPTADPVPTSTPIPEVKVVIPSAEKTWEDEQNYWTLPIGEWDEEKIWEVMMQPIIVLAQDGKDQKDVYPLRKEPDNSSKSSNIVGEITYYSQGVHILETLDNGWTLVECYNSSYGPNCTSRPGYGVTDDLICGYVKTSLLKTITPRTDYALLIDKLEQKLYIFSEGKCIGSLLVSTGLNNSTQSWNETPSGEFLMVSRMGGFAAGNLWCAYGMRVNGGCAIHEVPYIGNNDTPTSERDYSSTLPQLGHKASHGCIRVQKAANEQGQNIKWLWDNIKVNTKVLIWDDTGRPMEYPDDDTVVYYNRTGGKNYHLNKNCTAVASRYRPLTAITYKRLNEEFSTLTPCQKCATTLMTKDMIDEYNRENGMNVPVRATVAPEEMHFYYNPKGGKLYHVNDQCTAVSSTYWPLTEVSWADLNDPTNEFSKLTPCSVCGADKVKK